MAVPNNYIDKIKKDGDSRMISPAADMVRVDNDNFEGTDLDEVLDEVAQAIKDAGDGGYAPPAGGIPKTDLSQADTALQSYTETDPTVPSWAKQPTKPTYTAQEVGALPANTTIPSKTSDLTNDSGFTTNVGTITGITMNGASKGTSGVVDLGTVITEHQSLASKQDTLTFDNTPTAGSNNPVKSGGIKTALDAKANAADVPTNQDMADAIDDALGEAQVTVVPEGSVGIINSLGSDSSSDALSAAMGKKLKVAIMQIYSSLGSYAFPNGRPTLDFDDIVTFSVTKTIGTGLSATGGSTEVLFGYPLEVTIAITDNLYIIDEDNIVVTMGGQPVAGAWNASTMKVTIAAVTGNVVINVPSLTYVDGGNLKFFLDGRNRGGTAGHWVDRIGNVDFSLTNVTENDNNVVFGSTSNATSNGTLDVDALTSTVECGYILADNIASNAFFSILRNTTNDKVSLGFMNSADYGLLVSSLTKGSAVGVDILVPELPSASYKKGYLSIKLIQSTGVITPEQGGYFNGERVLEGDSIITFSARASLMLMNNGTNAYPGTLFYLRVYDRRLTDAEILQNYKVDQKRFNIQ